MIKYRTLILALVIIASFTGCNKKKRELPHYPVGGNFTLTDHDGNKFSLSDARGSAVLLFFGYTNCPDACPTILSRLNKLMKKMNADSGKIKILFVTVDPERDGNQKLKKYLEYFQLNVKGLRGNKSEIAEVAKLYGVYYNKRHTESRSGYSVDHTTTLFVLDKKGDVRYMFRYEDDERVLIPVLKLIL